MEAYHGAVVDHVGDETTRGLNEAAEVVRILAKLDDVVGTTVPADVALIMDGETNGR